MLPTLLYLHPPRNLRTPGFLAIPAGAFGVVNQLRRGGYPVMGFNLSIEMLSRSDFSLEAVFRAHEPRVALIDLHWYEHACGAMETAAYVKAIDPSCLVILGGLTATIFAKEILRDHPCIDVVVRGEAEASTRQLVDAIFRRPAALESIPGLTFRRGEAIVETPLPAGKAQGQDEYDYVDFSWLHNADLYLHATPAGLNSPFRNYWLMVGTGCPFNCSYCGGARDALARSFGRRRMWTRAAERIAADMERLWRSSVEIVNPTHDFAIMGTGMWEPLFASIRQAGVRLGVYNELFQLPSRQFLCEFARTFRLDISTLVFSPLAGDEATRRRNGKLYSNEELLDRLSLCRELGLRAELGFSKNLPGTDENRAALQDKLVQDIQAVYPGIVWYSQEITLDPKSNMAMNPDRYGIKRTFNSFADYVAYTAEDLTSPMRNGYELVDGPPVSPGAQAQKGQDLR